MSLGQVGFDLGAMGLALSREFAGGSERGKELVDGKQTNGKAGDVGRDFEEHACGFGAALDGEGAGQGSQIDRSLRGMNLVFAPEAGQDYLYWQSTDTKQVRRINLLLKEIAREPFTGIGKPEPLKHEYRGCWSRRIDGEHWVVYKVSGENVWLLQLRFHY